MLGQGLGAAWVCACPRWIFKPAFSCSTWVPNLPLSQPVTFMMTFLALLFIAKIVVTLVALIIPFLLFKIETLDRLAGFGQPNLAFYRLYGMAMLALVVAYAGGLFQAVAGVYPAEIVLMGLVSNVGASMIMAVTGYARHQRGLTVFFGLVGVGFAFAFFQPAAAMMQVL